MRKDLAEKRGHSGALCLKAAIHGVAIKAWSRVSFLVPFLKISGPHFINKSGLLHLIIALLCNQDQKHQ